MGLLRIIQLTEYETSFFAAEELPASAMQHLHSQYSAQIQLTPPSQFNNQQWEVTPLGIAGTLPLTPTLHLNITPRIAFANIFGMLTTVYDFPIDILEGVTTCHSLPQFYDRLAVILGQRVLHRCRLGLHREYISRRDSSQVLRGRMNLGQAVTRPWEAAIECEFEEQTMDIPINQALTWTMWLIARSGHCLPTTLPLVTAAFRALNHVTTLRPFSAEDCRHFSLDRLTLDYAPLLTLCRFYLEHSAPAQADGDYEMLPFLIDMGQLFERFTAAWLTANLPPPWHVKAQEIVTAGTDRQLHFRIDLVIYDAENRPQFVLDTKYKKSARASQSDIQQIIAYAQVKGCRQAMLIYPSPLAQPLDIETNQLRVRSFTFDIAGNLENAGNVLVSNLLHLKKIAPEIGD